MLKTALTWLLNLSANDWGLIATWVGTFLSGGSAGGGWLFHKKHLTKARLPQLLKELKKETGHMASLLISDELFRTSVDRFHGHSQVVRSIIASIQTKAVSGSIRSDCKAIIKIIKKTKSSSWSHDDGFDLHVQIRSLETSIYNTIKDLEV